MKVAFVALVLCLASSAYAANCPLTQQPPSSTNKGGYCSWYDGEDNCCPPGMPDSADSSASGACADYSSGCHDQLNLFMCGLVCSPDAGDFQINASATTLSLGYICTSFAKDIYDACKDDEYPTAGGCKKVGDEWSDSKAFAEKGLMMQVRDENCLNGASSMIASVAVLAVALAAVLA